MRWSDNIRIFLFEHYFNKEYIANNYHIARDDRKWWVQRIWIDWLKKEGLYRFTTVNAFKNKYKLRLLLIQPPEDLL